jgi:hypothetical protein
MLKVAAFTILSFFFIKPSSSAQDPEFAKGFVMHLRWHNGMVTNFHSQPDLYVAGLQVVPQVTVIPAKLRIGAVAGAFYTNKNVDALFGPTLSYKLKTFNAGPFGSAANIHITVDHLWGTNKQQLFGGGLHLDLLNKLTLGITSHRDYKLSNWWLQTAVGIRISKIKTTTEPFNQ